ncbi:hypothetical protein [Rhodococcus sp. EPR-157]|jgi:[ribosomal protein S5]-alanine N-acetyltransferase|uniref:hypothetical protein n=1 Tax=Rhodococcus sp. EPR-157 TaxID=1813677 RepID=UPI0012E757A5|nr:hypothetical protein [Rhodococcus sp. EPR-157]
MTIAAKPWERPVPERSQLHLNLVPACVVHTLAAGESAALTLDYVSPTWRVLNVVACGG